MPLREDAVIHQTHRRVLRPDTTVIEVNEFAKAFQWPLVSSTERDRDAGIDGQVIWQADGNTLWGDVLEQTALHYLIDATAGIGYYVFTGPQQDMIEALAETAAKVLDPWTVEDLFRAFDEAHDLKTRGQAALRLGLAAGPEFDLGVFTRISAALSDTDPRLRYAALWAATYSEYREFLPDLDSIAANDPEDWIRERAASILHTFEETQPA